MSRSATDPIERDAAAERDAPGLRDRTPMELPGTPLVISRTIGLYSIWTPPPSGMPPIWPWMLPSETPPPERPDADDPKRHRPVLALDAAAPAKTPPTSPRTPSPVLPELPAAITLGSPAAITWPGLVSDHLARAMTLDAAALG